MQAQSHKKSSSKTQKGIAKRIQSAIFPIVGDAVGGIWRLSSSSLSEGCE
jgi:hypothetical protein